MMLSSFFEAQEVNVAKLKDLLTKYCIAFGQEINYDKLAAFYSSNTPDDMRADIDTKLGIPGTQNPGKYLGLLTL